MEFKYDGGGLAKGGTVSLFVDGKKDGEGRVEQTVPMLFSADETCDVGKETGSPVSPDYGPTRQRVQRRGELGSDRPGEGRSRSPDHPGGALPGRDGGAIGLAVSRSGGWRRSLPLARWRERVQRVAQLILRQPTRHCAGRACGNQSTGGLEYVRKAVQRSMRRGVRQCLAQTSAARRKERIAPPACPRTWRACGCSRRPSCSARRAEQGQTRPSQDAGEGRFPCPRPIDGL